MKKLLLSAIGMLLLVVTACGADNLNVSIEQDLIFKKEKPSNFAIKVEDEKGPVEDLKIDASFSMLNMDHGTVVASFKEQEKGIYSTEVELPMAGDWEIVFTITQEEETIEKVLEYEVQEPSGVASINGEWITNEDIEFYRFINELHIAISKEQDKAKYKGEELEEALANWDNQEKLIQDQNQLLTQIIRLRAMALLGEEKGHEATKEEVDAQIENVRAQYGEHQVALDMIKEYGEEKFWNIEQKQYELIVLSQKVQNDLISQVKKENPDVNDQEVLYLAQKQYEELLVAQVNSLKIDLM